MFHFFVFTCCFGFHFLVLLQFCKVNVFIYLGNLFPRFNLFGNFTKTVSNFPIHLILSASPHIQYPQIRQAKNPNIHQIRKYFTINIYFSWLKRNCRIFPDHTHRKRAIRYISLKHIQSKVISYKKSNKNTIYIFKNINYWNK